VPRAVVGRRKHALGGHKTVLLDAAFLQSFQLNLSSFCLIKGVRLNFFGYTRISGGIRFAKA